VLTFGAGYRWNLTAAAGIYQMNRRKEKDKNPVDDNAQSHTGEREENCTGHARRSTKQQLIGYNIIRTTTVVHMNIRRGRKRQLLLPDSNPPWHMPTAV
jgi:hypothetical protein